MCNSSSVISKKPVDCCGCKITLCNNEIVTLQNTETTQVFHYDLEYLLEFIVGKIKPRNQRLIPMRQERNKGIYIEPKNWGCFITQLKKFATTSQ